MARILVVDDNADTCTNMSDILGVFGHDVRTAPGGRVALPLIRDCVFDIVLLDLKMPEMDGLQLYREIRQQSPATMAVLVTGYADPTTRQRAEQLGIWRVMSKPVDMSSIPPLIQEAARQPCLLLVDDDHEFCDSLSDVLRRRDFRVGIAVSAKEAVRQLTEREFQVIIVDWRLPDSDGLALLGEIHDRQPSARTVLVTGFPRELGHFLDATAPQRADALCYKPLEMEPFLATLQTLTVPGSCRVE